MKCDTGDDVLEEDHSGRLSVDGAEDDGPRLLDEVDLPRTAPNSLFFPRNLVKQHAPDAGLDGDGQRLLGGHGRLVQSGCATARGFFLFFAQRHVLSPKKSPGSLPVYQQTWYESVNGLRSKQDLS